MLVADDTANTSLSAVRPLSRVAGGAAFVLALALAACGHAAGPADPAPSPAGSSAPATSTPSAPIIPGETLQLVTAVIPAWDATTAELRLYERGDAKAPWRLADGPWQGVIGRAGAGWGIGRHGAGAPAGRSGPGKQEGDGRSPAGAFALTASYGYAAAGPAGSGMPYQQTDDNWKCVDDATSARYNTILDKRTAGAVDWTSAEEMHRPDELYTWVVEVAHNPGRTPNGGSCIFLHVWSGAGSTTVGCTAMPEPKLAGLIGTLSAAKRPMFVLLPRSEYEALAPAWDLPAL